MRRFALHLAILATIALTGAVLVVGFGLYNVSARQGHLPGVSWVLHTTFRQSVKLRAPPPEAVPDLSSPDMIALGARHYDGACRMCHGAPHEARPATIRAMEPEPPPIVEAVEDWQANHLFWIVDNGAKMTGMPAWPTAHRDDDVWPVIAFLQAAPRMSLAHYNKLAAAPGERTDARSYCANCHGEDGRGHSNRLVPRLDILGEAYIAASLEAYRSGARASGIMQNAASMLEDADIASLAHHFAAQDAAEPTQGEPNRELIEQGRLLAMGQSGDRDIAACRACHGPWPDRLSERFPGLDGQRRDYLRAQLCLWRAGTRGGSDRADLMHKAATSLTDEQIDALTAFYASRGAE